MKTVLRRSDLLHAISNLAYVIADVSEGKESPHTLHQTFDICEDGNLERVDSLLRLAAAEISAVSRRVRMTVRKGDYHLLFGSLTGGVARNGVFTEAAIRKFTELTREYMIASVLYGWLSVTLPSAAAYWSLRKAEVMTSLQSIISGLATGGFSRRVAPI